MNWLCKRCIWEFLKHGHIECLVICGLNVFFCGVLRSLSEDCLDLARLTITTSKCELRQLLHPSSISHWCLLKRVPLIFRDRRWQKAVKRLFKVMNLSFVSLRLDWSDAFSDAWSVMLGRRLVYTVGDAELSRLLLGLWDNPVDLLSSCFSNRFPTST